MSRSFELPEVDWATVGTVGEPGHRTFYIQARQGDQLVTLKLEKQQVAAVAQFLGEILSDLPAPQAVPPETDLELVEPVLAEWAVGSIQLAYDGATDRIVVMAEEMGPLEELDISEAAGDPFEEAGSALDEPSEDPDDLEDLATAGMSAGADQAVGRMAITREQAAGIVRRSWDLVKAGRPPCPLCGHPIDPEGHSCPRTNGHRPPSA